MQVSLEILPNEINWFQVMLAWQWQSVCHNLLKSTSEQNYNQIVIKSPNKFGDLILHRT